MGYNNDSSSYRNTVPASSYGSSAPYNPYKNAYIENPEFYDLFNKANTNDLRMNAIGNLISSKNTGNTLYGTRSSYSDVINSWGKQKVTRPAGASRGTRNKAMQNYISGAVY
jgi:hypothetical protein